MRHPECPICEGSGWVCENHEELPWDDGPGGPFVTGCACGAGAPCRCNPLHRDQERARAVAQP